MKISEPLRRLMSDRKPEAPRQVTLREMVKKGPILYELVDHERLRKIDTAAEEADEGAVVDLGENADLVEDLVGGFGAAELGALHGDGSAVGERAAKDVSVAAGAEEVFAGEVGGGAAELAAGEDCGGAAAGVVGVEDLLSLPSEAFARAADAALAAVEEEAGGEDQRCRAQAGDET